MASGGASCSSSVKHSSTVKKILATDEHRCTQIKTREGEGCLLPLSVCICVHLWLILPNPLNDCGLLCYAVLLEPLQQPLPAVLGRRLAIAGPIVGVEGVRRVRIDDDFRSLLLVLERLA